MLRGISLVSTWGFCLAEQDPHIQNLLPWLHFRHAIDVDRAGIKETQTWAKPQEIPRRRDLTLEDYQREFEGQIPVVLEGVYENMPCLKDGWIENNIMKNHLEERVVFLAHTEKDDRIMSTKMKTFVKNINKNSQFAWSYLRDEYFLPRHPDLMELCPPLPPFLEGQDQFALMPPKFIPPNATLLWGGRYSRSKLHVDPYNWTGTNVVLRGEKFFRLIPPGNHDERLDVSIRSCHMAMGCQSYESATDLFQAVPQGVPLWETKLQSGEVLIIPSGWWHQAVNLGTTLAIASGLITPGSGTWPTVAEVVRFHSTAHPSWRWGKLPSPPSEEIGLTEVTRRFRRFINALPAEAFKAADKFVKEKSQFQQRQEL